MQYIVRRLVVSLALIGAIGLATIGPAPAQQKKDKQPPVIKVGTFELYKDKGGNFRYRLKDDEGDILAIAPSGYETKADCQKAIDAVKRLAAAAKVDDQAK